MELKENSKCQTVMLTYEIPFGSFDKFLETLTGAYDDFLSFQPGFIGAAIHANEAKTRIASYSQWADREDFLAVLRTEKMQAVNKLLGDMSKGFEPVLYDINRVYEKRR